MNKNAQIASVVVNHVEMISVGEKENLVEAEENLFVRHSFPGKDGEALGRQRRRRIVLRSSWIRRLI